MQSCMDTHDFTLELLSVEDAEQLLAFEQSNKEWFEQFIPPREPDFYCLQGVTDHIQEFLLDYHARQLLPLLIKSPDQTIIGRINFTSIDSKKGTAHVGYRIGKAFTSQGVAKRALAMAKIDLKEKGIKRLFAYAEQTNIASQRVLTANGFRHIRTVKDFAELHGRSISCIEYSCSLVG